VFVHKTVSLPHQLPTVLLAVWPISPNEMLTSCTVPAVSVGHKQNEAGSERTTNGPILYTVINLLIWSDGPVFLPVAKQHTDQQVLERGRGE
jgi:hypothetical protein